MANNLGSLVVSLGLDSAEFTKGMSKSQYEAYKSTENIKSQFNALGKYVAGLGIGAALVQSVRNTADYADEIGKLAQKAGASAEDVSKLSYAARQADVDNAQLAKALRALGEDALAGGKKLAALGIQTTDAAGQAKGSARLFGEVADAIASITDPQLKAAAAAELLGSKVGPELIPLLNQGSSGLKDMADEAQRFGRVVTDEAAKAAEQFNDNLTKLNETASGFAVSFGNPIISAVNKVVGQFELARKYSDSFYESLFRSGTSNAPQRIDDLKEKIDGLNKSLKDTALVGLPRARVEDAISSAKKDIAMLTEFQRRENLADNARLQAQFGSDSAKLRSLRARTETFVPTPVKTSGSTTSSFGGGKSSVDKSLADYQRLLDDYANAEDANRMKIIRDRARQEEADAAAALAASRQPAIDELETLEARNVAYQDWLKNLQDQTPTAQLEAQRQAMADLAAEYERGTFGAAGSAEAIAKYGEIVNTYLGNLKVGAEQINASAAAAGSIFGSWLDKAITDGAKLSDVINGLINDLVRLAIQKAVIEPAAAGFTTFVGGLLGGTASFDGGGYTGSGARSGGVDGKGGFPAILHPNETVIDHTRGQSMGGSVSVSYTIDARGADPGSEMRIRQAIKESEARTKNDILASMNKGGTFARASGRA